MNSNLPEGVRKAIEQGHKESELANRNLGGHLLELANKIDEFTGHKIFFLGDLTLSKIMIEYSKNEGCFKDRYDGLFWGNEGDTGWGEWVNYKHDKKLVEMIDTFFIEYRKHNYPHLRHIGYTYEYLTRLDWLNDRD